MQQLIDFGFRVHQHLTTEQKCVSKSTRNRSKLDEQIAFELVDRKPKTGINHIIDEIKTDDWKLWQLQEQNDWF